MSADPKNRYTTTNEPLHDLVIPNHFTRICCLAFTCDNWHWPECFGCKTSGTCLCLEGFAVLLKCTDHPTACCVLWNGGYDCVVPRNFLKAYNQIFCFEMFCSLGSDGVFKATSSEVIDMPPPSAMENARFCCAHCCCIFSTNCWPCPKCCLDGCFCAREFLWCSEQFIYCRALCWEQDKPNPLSCCTLFRGQRILRRCPRTLCQEIRQYPMCDFRAAFPCTSEVPCIYGAGIPCMTCCVNYGCKCTCCATMGELNETSKVAAAPSAGDVQMVQRY